MNPNPDFWTGKRVLLTGHTGFKGWWLSCWLHQLGAKVIGLSDGPLDGQSLYKSADASLLEHEFTVDIRAAQATHQAIVEAAPDVTLHLAAQSLVRLSYDEPIDTFATNVMGTVHVLNALRSVKECRSIVCVTSDKCYENREWVWAYRENEAMGGHDPYSASKGAAELAISSYRRSFVETASCGLASVRAGNVIGGGDWAKDRLIPDCLRAFASATPVEVRNPVATRPWQHVLEPLSGYILLAEKLYTNPESHSEAWNFGPRDEDVKPVSELVETMVGLWGEGAAWQLTKNPQPHEAVALNVDASKAAHRLKWTPRLPIDQALTWTIDWHRRHEKGEAANSLCTEQINAYCAIKDAERNTNHDDV